MAELIDLEGARGYVQTFIADPVLKMAANAVLNNAPRVEAVEVVRCKDCKHYKSITCSCSCQCVSDNWYCADGERKVEDG